MPDINMDGLPDDVVEYITDLEKAVGDAADLLDGDLDDDPKGDDTKDDDPKPKAEDDPKEDDKVDEPEPALAKLAKADPAVAELIKSNEKMKSDLEKAQQDIEKERSVREIGEYVSKAKDEFKNINKSPADLGLMLFNLHKADAKLANDVTEVLKAADAQLDAASIFGELGKSGANTTVSGSVEAKAAELRKANPELTEEQAIAQAYADDDTLYNAHLTGDA